MTEKELDEYQKLFSGLKEEDRELLKQELNYYVITVADEGGIPMPIALGLDWADGSSEEVRVPVEVWRKNPESVAKLVVSPKELVRVTLDPHLEIADTDPSDNLWPPEMEQATFQLNEGGGEGRRGRGGPNPMREALEAGKAKAGKGADEPVEAASGAGSGGR